jgi:hypothetical protein
MEDSFGPGDSLHGKRLRCVVKHGISNSSYTTLFGAGADENKTNTTIKFQVATLARSPADAGLASWISNGNFLLTLAMGPIFVSHILQTYRPILG